MIYTVTFNPSLDYIVDVPDFQAGQLNRTRREKILPGGKGINVSIVLKNMGHDSTALGFTGGFTGREIRSLLAEYGVVPAPLRPFHRNSPQERKRRRCSVRLFIQIRGVPEKDLWYNVTNLFSHKGDGSNERIQLHN